MPRVTTRLHDQADFWRVVNQATPAPADHASPAAQKACLWALAGFSFGAACWPSVELLAARTCLAPRTVRRALAALRACGWLTTEQRTRDAGGHSTNSYLLDLVAIAEACGIELAGYEAATKGTVPTGRGDMVTGGGGHGDRGGDDEVAGGVPPKTTPKPKAGQDLQEAANRGRSRKEGRAENPTAPPAAGPAPGSIVKDLYLDAYRAATGLEFAWSAKAAALAKAMADQVRVNTPEGRDWQVVASQVIDAYLADQDPFLVRAAHPFDFLKPRLMRYLVDVVGATRTGAGTRNKPATAMGLEGTWE